MADVTSSLLGKWDMLAITMSASTSAGRPAFMPMQHMLVISLLIGTEAGTRMSVALAAVRWLVGVSDLMLQAQVDAKAS